jgi:hypothetical protein
MINFQEDNNACPENYKATHKWLYEHSQILYRGASRKDPHILSLHMFEVKDKDTGKYMQVYDVINRYLDGIRKKW